MDAGAQQRGVNARGPVRWLFWSVVRPGYLALFRGAGWLLGWISPVAGKALELGCWDLYEALKLGRYARPAVARLRIGEVRFSLAVPGGHVKGQDQYLGLAQRDEVYEPVMVECVARMLRRLERPAFIDIGAFVGYYACYVTALLGDREPTYAVESNPRYVRCLEGSIRLNGFTNMRVLSAVLSDRTESARIVREAVHFGEGAGAAQTITLDELCAREGIRPKIVKIDVHGAEGKVLAGMPRLLRESVEFVLLEVHPLDFLKRYSAGVSRKELLDGLEALGFHLWYVAGHRYSRSDGLEEFLSARRLAYRRLDAASRELLLFDRHVDIFLIASKTPDLAEVLDESALDPALAR